MNGIELTPDLLALVPLVAAIIQMAKKFPVLSKFGDYFPVLAMALGFGGTFAIGEPAGVGQKVIAGIVIGLTASGGYEALKGRGTTVATILLLCLLPLCLCGCMDSQEIIAAKSRLAEVRNMADKCGTVSPEVCCQGLAAAVKAIEADITAAQD